MIGPDNTTGKGVLLCLSFLAWAMFSMTAVTRSAVGESCSFTVRSIGYTSPYAILTGGPLTITGNPEITGTSGSIHSNGDIAIGGSANISGNVTAAGHITLSGSPDVNGSVTDGVAPAQIPSVNPAEYAPYADYQLRADGKVYQPDGSGGWTQIADCSGNGKWNNWDYRSSEWSLSKKDTIDGTLFIEGDVDISGNPGSESDPWKATIIATGSIQVSGNAEVIPNPNNPPETRNLLFVAGGDLRVTGTPNQGLHGIMAVHEQVHIGGNPRLDGCIFAEDAAHDSGLVTDNVLTGNMDFNYGGLSAPFGSDQVIPITEPF